MTSVDIDIEDLIRQDIAGKLLETLPEDTKQQLLERSLTKSLENVLSSWSVEKAIRLDVEKYMVEYIKNDDVQRRIREATFKSVDVLLDGVTKAIVIGAQDKLQNTYAKWVKENKNE